MYYGVKRSLLFKIKEMFYLMWTSGKVVSYVYQIYTYIWLSVIILFALSSCG